MERVAGDVDGGELLVGDLDLGVLVVVEAGVDLQGGAVLVAAIELMIA